MKTFIRWLIPVALVPVFACSDAVEPPSGGGSGGSTPDETLSSSVSSGTGDTPEETTSSSASTGGNAPVACDSFGGGAPPGAPCAVEGESCDYACTSCGVVCTDGVWVERCTACPVVEVPENGTDCSAYYGVGPCSYKLECGTVSATCDGPTGLWEVSCGNESDGSGGANEGGGGGNEGGGGDAEGGGEHEGGCG
ncbi:hypothetical protein WME79_29140 [Sorangium sp. So ce726]|uniref:hypothetical protein n=1 Tax=Sorangium sp. So ce726 TaxID=3133319 RepID=UPI003F617BC2